ncbi:MAG: archaeosine tRNA-ribosyltransferase [Methanobacteriaceae archaeon]|nr:archaeosine tRNA-ribosyltransferase [Methanobacteriaceae archaeon]
MLKIKKHDGPARLGQWNEKETPTIIDYKTKKIIQSNPAPYNIPEELANELMIKTLEIAENTENKEDKIGIIQGSKYTNLRIDCAKKLEKLGYTTLLIANTDNLQKNPQEMLDIIIRLRENIKPTTTLYYPFAITPLIPLLSYIGIDLFDYSRAIYEAQKNRLMTSTNIYDINKYLIIENNNLQTENIKNLKQTVIETRKNIENKTLRNIVEQRCTAYPETMTTLRILDKKYYNYLNKYTPLY